MDKQTLLKLLKKYERNECTTEEIEALKKWYQSFPELEADLFNDEPEEIVAQRLWVNITRDMELTTTVRFRWVWGVAASVVCLLLATFWFWPIKEDISGETILTSSTEKLLFYLPDSSKLILEPNSMIRYDREFLHNRKVYLEGACLFHVTHRYGSPFQVYAKEQITTVTGTIFSMRAYPNETEVITHLLEGNVNLSNVHDSKQIVLNPDDIVVFSVASRTFSKVKENRQIQSAISETVKPVLNLNAVPYDEIFTKLEQQFGVTIFVDGEALGECLFSAKFQDESLEEILTILASVNHFKFYITGKIVYIEDFEC